MKFNRNPCLLFVILLFLTASNAISAQTQRPELRIAYPEFPPFHWRNKDNSMAGFFYDIITEALEKRMGIQLVWTAYPWTRCQETVKSGTEDAILTVPTEERTQYTKTHKVPFYRKELHVFTYTDHPRMTDLLSIRFIADIRKHDFSVITYSGNGWHKKNVASLGIKTYETPYLDNVWLMLAKQRGDLVIEWPQGANPSLIRLGLQEQVVDTETILSSMPFHLLIRKGSSHTAILEQFDNIINTMQADGTIISFIRWYTL